jgi:hypothetical protein
MIGRSRAIVAFALVGVAVALAAVVLVRLPNDAPSPSASPGPSPSRSAATPAPAEATARAYPGTPLLPGEPLPRIGAPTQSRLWSAQDTWYGVTIDPATRESRIGVMSEDGTTWTDSGVLIDERPGAMVDALWDGERLLTLSAVPGRSTANGLRLSRFTLADDGTFGRDANFPVPLTERGVTSATIARDSAGRLWAAFVQNEAVLVAHSSTDDAVWSDPGTLPGSGRVSDDDLVTVLATGAAQVAVAWSDAPDATVHLALRRDDAEPDTWQAAEVAFTGLPLADRPISAAAADGIVAIGIQTTAPPDDTVGSTDVDSLVAVRDPSGAWRTGLTSRTGDRLGSPVVVLDPAAGMVYAFLTSPRRAGAIYLKPSPVDRLDFPSGLGILVIDDPTTPVRATALTSAKSPVSLAGTFVIQALDEGTGIPWHALLGPAAGSPDPSAGATPAPSVTPSKGPTARVLIDDDFAPWAEGAVIGNGWEIKPDDALGTLVAAGSPAKERHAALRSDTVESVRACKTFPAVTSGAVVVDHAIRADAIGDSDVVITSVRAGLAEAASVRFGQGGTFAYYAGEEKIRTSAGNRLEAWLGSRVTVHLDTETYDWRLSAADGTVIVEVRDVPFREPVDEGASSVCIATSSGPSRPVVRFDDMRVSH